MSVTPPSQPSRQTYQAQAVELCKKDARQLLKHLDDYAGESNKPNIIEVQVAHYMGELGEWLPTVIRARHLPGIVQDTWDELQQQYNNGTGSWTKCLPYARRLDELLQQCEG